MKPLRIVFMGSPDFAVPSLKVLHSSPHNIVAVVSGPDKRRGRGNETSPTVVKKAALDLGLQVIEAEDLKSPELEAQLKRLEADLFVVVAFRILPAGLLDIPAIGSINLHASLLPAYRGAAPIHHAVMNGETVTGCTVFFLNEQVDTGNILVQEKTTISPEETTGDVYDRLMHLGAALMLNAVELISMGGYELQRQDDSMASPAPKLHPDSCRIDFRDPVNRVYNKIRGLSPYPGAWAILDGQRFRIHSAIPYEYEQVVNHLSSNEGKSEVKIDQSYPALKPGEIGIIDDAVVAGCSVGAIRLLNVQLEGKKSMDAGDFFRGYKGLCNLE